MLCSHYSQDTLSFQLRAEHRPSMYEISLVLELRKTADVDAIPGDNAYPILFTLLGMHQRSSDELPVSDQLCRTQWWRPVRLSSMSSTYIYNEKEKVKR